MGQVVRNFIVCHFSDMTHGATSTTQNPFHFTNEFHFIFPLFFCLSGAVSSVTMLMKQLSLHAIYLLKILLDDEKMVLRLQNGFLTTA